MKLLPSWSKFLYNWSFVHAASLEAGRLGDAKIGPEHALCGLVSQGHEASRLLSRHNATLPALRQACRAVETADAVSILGSQNPISTATNLRGMANHNLKAVVNMTPTLAKSRLFRRGTSSSMDALLQLLSLPSTRINDILSAAHVDAEALKRDAELILAQTPADRRLGSIVARRLTNHRGRRAIEAKQRSFISTTAEELKTTLQQRSFASTVLHDQAIRSKQKNKQPAEYSLRKTDATNEESIRWEMHVPPGKRSPSYSQYHQFTVTDSTQGCLVDHMYEFELPTWPPTPTWYSQLAVVLIPQRIAHFIVDRQTSPQ